MSHSLLGPVGDKAIWRGSSLTKLDLKCLSFWSATGIRDIFTSPQEKGQKSLGHSPISLLVPLPLSFLHHCPCLPSYQQMESRKYLLRQSKTPPWCGRGQIRRRFLSHDLMKKAISQHKHLLWSFSFKSIPVINS
jgi:hypothetical protein